MSDSQKQTQKKLNSNFESEFAKDIIVKNYAEAVRLKLELILDNHDNKAGVLTKDEGIEMLRDCVKLSDIIFHEMHTLIETKYRLINTNGELNERMRNMESMIFE